MGGMKNGCVRANTGDWNSIRRGNPDCIAGVKRATLRRMTVSVEEYLSTVYEPDREYVEGEPIERNVGDFEHSALLGILIGMLSGQRRAAGIHIFPTLRVQVAARLFRVPDITVTTRKIKGRILREPPLLCIEILSPEDRANRLLVKINDYFAFGVR